MLLKNKSFVVLFLRPAVAVLFCAILGQLFPDETRAALYPHDIERHAADSSFEGATVDTISVEARNIFETSTPKYDRWLYRLANKFHRSTRKRIVEAEILLKEGEPFTWDVAYETERNLRHRLALFDARVTPRLLADGRLLVEIITIDVWSLSSGLNVHREGGETDYDFSTEERNFLGMNQFVTLNFTKPAHEKAHMSSSFRDIRFAGKPIAVDASWSNGSIHNYSRLSVSHPFYALSQRVSASLLLAKNGGRFDRYSDSTLMGQSWYNAKLFSIRGAYRFGSGSRKLSAWTAFTYNDEKKTRTLIYSASGSDSANILHSLPQDSLYYLLGIGVGLSDERYRELRHIDGFSKIEDVPVGVSLLAEAGQARHKQTTLYDAFFAGASYVLHHRGGFLYVSEEGSWWLREGKQLRKKSATSFRWYYYRPSFVTVTLHGSTREDAQSQSDEPLVLGGKTGLRGYDTRFKTGQRVVVLGAESRFFPGLEILSAQVGGVLFVDAARVWDRTEPFRFRDFYYSVGFGLRVAPERMSRGIPIRFDFAYSEKFGWTISASTGQYFTLLSDNFLLTSR